MVIIMDMSTGRLDDRDCFGDAPPDREGSSHPMRDPATDWRMLLRQEPCLASPEKTHAGTPRGFHADAILRSWRED